jgi:hypothetical protein
MCQNLPLFCFFGWGGVSFTDSIIYFQKNIDRDGWEIIGDVIFFLLFFPSRCVVNIQNKIKKTIKKSSIMRQENKGYI